jgi:hypothetical protein
MANNIQNFNVLNLIRCKHDTITTTAGEEENQKYLVMPAYPGIRPNTSTITIDRGIHNNVNQIIQGDALTELKKLPDALAHPKEESRNG